MVDAVEDIVGPVGKMVVSLQDVEDTMVVIAGVEVVEGLASLDMYSWYISQSIETCNPPSTHFFAFLK